MKQRGRLEEQRSGQRDLAQGFLSFKNPLSLLYLHLNVKNADAPLRRHVLDRFDARAIIVARELRVLNESAGIHQPQELIAADEVVLAPVLLAWPGRPSCVWSGTKILKFSQLKKQINKNRNTRTGKKVVKEVKRNKGKR